MSSISGVSSDVVHVKVFECVHKDSKEALQLLNNMRAMALRCKFLPEVKLVRITPPDRGLLSRDWALGENLSLIPPNKTDLHVIGGLLHVSADYASRPREHISQGNQTHGAG